MMLAVTILKSIQWGAIAILFFLLTYAARQKPSEMQKHVLVLTMSCILMLAGYIAETSASNMESALVGVTVSYMGKPLVMVSSFLLISAFYGMKTPKPVFIVMCFYCALMPLLVATNEYHHLYYSAVTYNPTALFTPLTLGHGPLYILNIGSIALFFLSTISVILVGYLRSKSTLRKRMSVYSFLMALSGIVGYAIYILKLTNGYDSTMAGVSVGVVFLSVLFFRCRIFDLVDRAKEYALDNSPEGLLVLDDSKNIVYQNRSAGDFMANCLPVNEIDLLDDGKNVYRKGNTSYSVNISSVTHGREYLGKSVEIHDITESMNYQQMLEKAIYEAKEKVSVIQRTVLGSVASIVEARSLETGDHIRRVSDYSELIAKKMREQEKYASILTDEYISTLVLAAPLHDVGKISIPDAILMKPGKLDEAEFEIMKRHAACGAQIVRNVLIDLETDEYIDMAEDVAMYHHERWDGTGYPCSLKGETIPLSARIVALADCFDALTSERCYKPPMSREEAMQMICDERGTHFDPAVVDAFVSCMHGTRS